MTSTWGSQIAETILDESKRHRLAAIPLALVSSVEYAPDWVYVLSYLALNRN